MQKWNVKDGVVNELKKFTEKSILNFSNVYWIYKKVPIGNV